MTMIRAQYMGDGVWAMWDQRARKLVLRTGSATDASHQQEVVINEGVWAAMVAYVERCPYRDVWVTTEQMAASPVIAPTGSRDAA